MIDDVKIEKKKHNEIDETVQLRGPFKRRD